MNVERLKDILAEVPNDAEVYVSTLDGDTLCLIEIDIEHSDNEGEMIAVNIRVDTEE